MEPDQRAPPETRVPATWVALQALTLEKKVRARCAVCINQSRQAMQEEKQGGRTQIPFAVPSWTRMPSQTKI